VDKGDHSIGSKSPELCESSRTTCKSARAILHTHFIPWKAFVNICSLRLHHVQVCVYPPFTVNRPCFTDQRACALPTELPHESIHWQTCPEFPAWHCAPQSTHNSKRESERLRPAQITYNDTHKRTLLHMHTASDFKHTHKHERTVVHFALRP
jgi:hypothetical protein